MFPIIGIVVVLACVVAGFLWEGGKVGALVQPAEFLIIGGAAVGSLLISTPPSLLKRLVVQGKGLLRAADGRDAYLELLTLMYQLFKLVHQSGMMALEAHFEDPSKSTILSAFPRFLARRPAVDFLADSVKVMIIGGVSPHDLEALLDEDVHSSSEHGLQPSATLMKIGDALPGLGIVAAVLGVVITMASIDGPPEEIGLKVGAALVGTFLGILMSYGFVQPIASRLEHAVGGETQYLQCLKAGLMATAKGLPPAIAVEFARRAIGGELRPSFDETEKACKASKGAAAPLAANAA